MAHLGAKAMSERIWGYILLERMPFRPRAILERVCKAHGVNPVNILGPSTTTENCAVRSAVWAALRAKGYPLARIGHWFNRGASAVHRQCGGSRPTVRPPGSTVQAWAAE